MSVNSAAGLIEVNIRDAAYGGAADVPADVQAGAQVRGILRFVGVFNNSGVAGEDVFVGFSASGAPPAFDPVTAYQVALTNGPGLALRVPVRPTTTSVFLNAAVGTPTVQLELWFDVPPAA
jgi:hypothetical protein